MRRNMDTKMTKSNYQEGLYYWGTFQIETDEVEQQILTLLCENHGVGIIGGYYEKDLPFCMVSDLTMQMLGYASAEEFERATGGCLAGLVKKEDYAEMDFSKPSDVYGLHLRGVQKNLWVRMMKREVVLSSGQKIWLASVCNMDALYQKELQVTRMTEDRYLQELAHQEKLEEANAKLEEQKMALERALEEAQRASLSKTDFLRRMSHDIRTPINGIRGMIEIAEHFTDDLQKQKECRDKVWEASGYLLSLVNNVLDMNKLESGAVVLTEMPFDLPQLLNEVNTVAEMQATEHGLYYDVDMEKQQIAHPYLIGSAPHLKQVLMNLASNAVKYNKENGRVTVWCRELSCDGKTAEFRFACKDTGIGMSKEFQKRAFEPFTQEGRDNARTHYDGTGLGLSIVQALVRQMGGSITFESEEGVGTSFLVTLPFQIDPNPQPKPKESVSEPIDLDGVRVLLAEDNDLNMEIATFFIEQHGAKVTTARNGREAVELFANAPQGTFDLILMDIMMPVMNGYEATETIRGMAREDAKTIPIIAMSANAFQDDIQKSRSVGMNDHLPKLLSTEKLLSAIARHTTPVL